MRIYNFVNADGFILGEGIAFKDLSHAVYWVETAALGIYGQTSSVKIYPEDGYVEADHDPEDGAKCFTLEREKDLSGVSGVGTVAEGAVFSGGCAVMRWLTAPSSIGVYDSLDDLIRIHGHDGATKVYFVHHRAQSSTE